MFLGRFEVNFTGKGRVVLPKSFREELKGDNRIILTQGMDGEVWGFERRAWERQAQKQLEIPLSTEEGRGLRRKLFSPAQESNLDNQGRFSIPEHLLNYARLLGSTLFIGAGDHFEIWDPDLFKKIIEDKNDTKKT